MFVMVAPFKFVTHNPQFVFFEPEPAPALQIVEAFYPVTIRAQKLITPGIKVP
jgi:hypothetical protein